MTEQPEDYMNETPYDETGPSKGTDVGPSKDDEGDVEGKREDLAILASLGTIKEYCGVERSLGDVRKMSEKDVIKFFNRYKLKLGRETADVLIKSSNSLNFHDAHHEDGMKSIKEVY